MWGQIPEEITLTRDEAATVLAALDHALETATAESALQAELEHAAAVIVAKLMPGIEDL